MPDLPEAYQPPDGFHHIVRGLSAWLVYNEHPVERGRKWLSGHNSI
jgi:hypothetical protein